jgi:hypothetical protein
MDFCIYSIRTSRTRGVKKVTNPMKVQSLKLQLRACLRLPIGTFRVISSLLASSGIVELSYQGSFGHYSLHLVEKVDRDKTTRDNTRQGQDTTGKRREGEGRGTASLLKYHVTISTIPSLFLTEKYQHTPNVPSDNFRLQLYPSHYN